jgi:hypothetical protein
MMTIPAPSSVEEGWTVGRLKFGTLLVDNVIITQIYQASVT